MPAGHIYSSFQAGNVHTTSTANRADADYTAYGRSNNHLATGCCIPGDWAESAAAVPCGARGYRSRVRS
jgi:hypothetical protein